MKNNIEIREKIRDKSIPLSSIMTCLVVCLVFIACVCGVAIFAHMYINSVEQNAITNSDQVVSQVENMVSNYIEDMSGIMQMVRVNIDETEKDRDDFFTNLLHIRKDVEAITVHSEKGEMIAYWSNRNILKNQVENNLSYTKLTDDSLFISAPHVQNLFKNYYP